MTHLFSPITLRGTEISNRIWLAPMCQYSCETGVGMPGSWHLVHLGARAQGGFGLILTEAAAVLPEGRISPQDAGIWNDEQAESWSAVVDFVHSQNSVIGVQLAHAGRKASTYRPFKGEPKGSVPESEGGWTTKGASVIAYPGLVEPEEMSKDDIAEAVEVSRTLTDNGVDLIDVSSGGNYPVTIPIGPGYQVPLSAAIRAAGARTGCVGLITDPQQAETILSTGQADAIFMARAALREPFWPQRAAHVLGVEPGPYPPQYTRGAW